MYISGNMRLHVRVAHTCITETGQVKLGDDCDAWKRISRAMNYNRDRSPRVNGKSDKERLGKKV